jgi:hypothetical protein
MNDRAPDNAHRNTLELYTETAELVAGVAVDCTDGLAGTVDRQHDH